MRGNVPLKYRLYEKAVQSPKVHADWFGSIYRELRGRYASRLREDFCGTFALSCEWVKKNRQNTALCVDLDPEPLAHGKKENLASLSAAQKRRLKTLRADVLGVKKPRVDLIVACNFSFFIFKSREGLLRYFRACYRSLDRDGVVLLEMAGGPGMIQKGKEQKSVYEKGKRAFTYIWDQKSFDPITHDARYSIHFRLPGGRMIRDAFTYDWRLWTIPEVRDLLREAGFRDSHVYWETAHRGAGTGEYVRMEHGDNSYAWLAYVVGTR